MNRKGCGRKPSGHELYIDLHRRLKSSQLHVLLVLSPDKTLTISSRQETGPAMKPVRMQTLFYAM
jgi:hypothetical protein